jgi:hypothetical protein
MDRSEYFRERDRKRMLDPVWIERKKEYSRKHYLKHRETELAKAKARYKKLHTYCTVCSKNYPLPDSSYCEECL